MTQSNAAFPADFLWGAATSAYQIEGSRDADGTGVSIWDIFTQRPGVVEGGGDGSRACDSYQHWEDDIALLQTIGLNAYRFSTGWSRVMPDGTGAANQLALDHYDRQVDALLAAGITPLITLNHWDMPQALMRSETDGGWLARSTAEAFTEYVAAVTARLGDRVNRWITQCEPWIVQLLGYQIGLHAPGIKDLPRSVIAGHHVLLGHGLAVEAINANVSAAQIGVALSLFPCTPASDSADDAAAAWGSDGYVNRWYLDPLTGRGYPADTRALWEEIIERESGGFSLDEVILPGDEAIIGRQLDFIGVNYYTRRVCAAAEVGPDRAFPWAVVGPSGDVARSDEGWEIVPDQLRQLLLRLDRDYDHRPLIITENGGVFCDTPMHDRRVHDNRRIAFIRGHLRAVAEAISQGATVLGYMHWSLLDNFEWALGYRPRFGLSYLDYATGQRTLKDSAYFYGEIARTGQIPAADPAIVPYG
jgi:beta-glucosidase